MELTPDQPTMSDDPAGQVEALVCRLQENPEDRETLDELLASSERWLRSEGLEAAPERESATRVQLAAWLAPLSAAGKVVHFGWREGAVAAALASTPGAEVTSYLDHPARAMAAAIRHGGPHVRFETLDRAAECEIRMADLVVVETAGIEPTVELGGALSLLRAGGWLAVLGAPLAGQFDGLVDAGRFRLDDAAVRPTAALTDPAELSLFRFAASTGPAKPEPAKPEAATTGSANPPAARTRPAEPCSLERIIAARDDADDTEREIRQRASRVIRTPLPDQGLIDWVGGGTAQTFHNIGLVNFHQLSLYCGLRPSHDVLEPGCGCGRNARPLAAFLDPDEGSYRGFDIHRGAIDWATRHITGPYPNVEFDFADIRNSNYNPAGRHAASEYVFPYDDESFDVVFMPSVFTHMTQDQLRHYASEIARVLRPGGLLLSWHFLLDEISRRGIDAGRASIDFKDYDDVSMAMLRDNPCAAIAFDKRWILECYESLGLRPQAVIHGAWSGRDPSGYSADYQDRVLARKKP